MKIIKTIEQETEKYLNRTIEISEGVNYSQYKLVKRISQFQNKLYPKGKLDKQGKYKYWFDIITPRVNNEVKNLRIDTKNPLIFSKNPVKDFAAVLIANAKLGEWMWETGRAEEMNDNTEMYSGIGNLLLKKVKDGYDTWDPANTYITNQTAKTVDETGIIERHQLTQSQIRAKEGVWENVNEVIKECKEKQFSSTKRTSVRETTNPYYEIFEYTGELTEKELYEAQGRSGGNDEKYILGKVIAAGLKKGTEKGKYILYAEELKGKMSDYYIEAHRGSYKGKWFREGLYELLFDHQIRANEIGNQLARGLEWASRVIFRSTDNRTIQNILTDISNGDIVKSADLSQVDVRMRGLDQLIADWNRVMADADKIANSFEIVSGEEMKGANMPFRLGLLLDTNANKLFVLLRQKLGLAYDRALKEWILPHFIKNIKGKDVIRLTGDAQFLNRFREAQVNEWYVKNLINIGPHTEEVAEAIKQAKMEQLADKDPILKNTKKIWESVLPRLWVTVTGENIDFDNEYQTIQSALQLETNEFRRNWLLDKIYAMRGLAVPPPVPVEQQGQLVKPTQNKEEKGVSEFDTVQTGV
jgi:hypothetical protein